jgi:hypothetical protein
MNRVPLFESSAASACVACLLLATPSSVWEKGVCVHLLVEANLAGHGDEDVVRLPHDLDPFRCNLAKYTNADTWTREGVPQIILRLALGSVSSKTTQEEL